MNEAAAGAGGSAPRGRPTHYAVELETRRHALVSSRSLQSPKHGSGKTMTSISLLSPTYPTLKAYQKQYSRPGTPGPHGSHAPPFFPPSGGSLASTAAHGTNQMMPLSSFHASAGTSGSTTPTLFASHMALASSSGRLSHAMAVGGGSCLPSPLPSPVGSMGPFDGLGYLPLVSDNRRVFQCTSCGMHIEPDSGFLHRIECSAPRDNSYASTPLTRSRSASPGRHRRASSSAPLHHAGLPHCYPLSPTGCGFPLGGADGRCLSVLPDASALTSPLPLSALATPDHLSHGPLDLLPPIAQQQQQQQHQQQPHQQQHQQQLAPPTQLPTYCEPFPRAMQPLGESKVPFQDPSDWNRMDSPAWDTSTTERSPSGESNGSRRRSPPLAPLEVPSARAAPWSPPTDSSLSHVCTRHAPDQVFHKLGDSYRCVGLAEAVATVPRGEDSQPSEDDDGEPTVRKFTIHVLQRCGGSSTKRYRKHMYLPDCDCGVAPFRSKLDVTQHMLSSKHQQPICDLCSELFPSYQARNSHRLRCVPQHQQQPQQQQHQPGQHHQQLPSASQSLPLFSRRRDM